MKILYTIFGIIVFSLFISWNSYQSNKTLFLPYIDMAGAHVSGFYTDVKVVYEDRSLDNAILEYANLKDILQKIVNSSEGTIERQYLDAFQGIVGERKLLLSSQQDSQSSYIIASMGEENSTCLVINIGDNDGTSELIFPPESTMHNVMAIFSAQCNQRKDLAIKFVSYHDYLFYAIFRCFGLCEKQNGIYFRNKIDNFSNVEIQVKRELAKQEEQYQGVRRNPEEIKVSDWKIYQSKTNLIVDFVYRNPTLGETPSSARFEVSESGEYKLLFLAKPDDLTSYFISR